MRRRSLHQRLVEFAQRSFDFWQSHGIHVTPVHYYQPVPDTRRLREKLWSENSELVGIDMRQQAQLELLNTFAEKYGPEYRQFPLLPTQDPTGYYTDNGFFEAVDGEAYYCMIRHFKPARVMEIGAGFSTRLAVRALKENASRDARPGELVVVEPFVEAALSQGSAGISRVIPSEVQDVQLAEFEQLRANDILFIDSSHVLTIGSDVHYEICEILPRLAPGVLVHFHDIYLPANYYKSLIVNQHMFWNEQYIVQAFLTFNSAFEVMWSSSLLHLAHSPELTKAFPSYRAPKHWPGSLWIRRK